MSQTVVTIDVGGTGANNASDALNNLGAVNKTGDVITGTLNVAATLITQNVLPDANVAYDLGSSSARFKDLWLSNSTIYLGEASISANGNTLVVPSIETISGVNVEAELSVVYTQANAAYDQANTARSDANTTFANINVAFSNTNSAFTTTNTTFGALNTSADTQNTWINNLNTATGTINTHLGNINSTFGVVNTAVTNAHNQANAAYAEANLKLNITGGTINGSLNVSGNLTITGNTKYVNVDTYIVTDPLIYLAANNDASDLVDIGFMGGHNTSGVYQHSGLVRDAGDGTWYLFTGLAEEGHENNVVDFANTSLATLRANINANSLIVSGDSNFDSGTLFVDSSNNQVGIGTESPAYTLDLLSSTTGYISRFKTSSNYGGILADAGSSGSAGGGYYAVAKNNTRYGLFGVSGAYIGDSSTDAALAAESGSNIRFFTNGSNTESMRITTAGNIGIGTTNPQAPLHVNRSGTSENQTIVLGLSSDSLRPIIQFSEGTDVNSGAGMAIEYDGRGTGGTNAIKINSVDNVPVQTFMSNGWVGFGTTSPVAPLNIVHTNLSGEPYSGLIIKNTSTTGAAFTGVTADGVLQSHYRFALNGALKWQWRVGSGSGVDRIDLYSWTAGTDVLSVANTGYVGIGFTNPSQRLTVGGEADTRVRIDSSSTQGIFFTKSGVDNGTFRADGSGNFEWYTKSVSQAMVLLANGNVGIGTASPTNKLTVNGSASFSGGAGFGGSTIDNFQLLGYESNVIRPVSAGYGGFTLRTFDGSNAGYILMRDTTDVDVYQQYGLTVVTDRGPLTLAARGNTIGDNSTRNFIRFMTAGGVGSAQVRMTINKDGHITMPAQPRFFAYGTNGGFTSTSSVWIFPSTRVNVGSHYNTSNGRFTAPVTGTYAFFWGNIGGNTDTVFRYFFRVNNSQIGDVHLRLDTSASGADYAPNGARFFMYPLNSGDYVTIHYISDSNVDSYPGGNDPTNDYPYFGGYLLG